MNNKTVWKKKKLTITALQEPLGKLFLCLLFLSNSFYLDCFLQRTRIFFHMGFLQSPLLFTAILP